MFRWKKDPKKQSVGELEVSVAQRQRGAKREMAKRLMKGEGVPTNFLLSVAYLEDCVADGDADAMLLLAECCALGHGIEQNRRRTEKLVEFAAMKGNDCAKRLMSNPSLLERNVFRLDRL